MLVMKSTSSKLRDASLVALTKAHITDYATQARLWDCVFTNTTLGQLNVIRETLIRVQDRYLTIEPKE